MRPGMAAVLLYLAMLGILTYAVWGLGLLLLQSRLLYRPTREVSLTPAELRLAYQPVAFPSSDGVRLTGWYVPAKDARFTVLLCHGNGGNIMHLLDSVGLFHDLRLNCFVFDYRGYGQSTGRPAEAGTYLDAQAAYDWLTGVKGIPAQQIILLGRSLGGSIAAHLAHRASAGGLVLESAFTSCGDVAAMLYPYLPVRLFTRFFFRYDTLAYVQGVHCPVLVMHSREDELVPFELAARLFEAANEPKRLVEICGSHNEGFLRSVEVYQDAWLKWLEFVKDHAVRDRDS